MSEIAKRYRAARAYAGLSQVQLGERLGLDEQTIKRREGGKGDPKLAEQIAVASVCGVPEEFMTRGWAAPTRDEIAERLEAMEDLLRAIETRSSQADLASLLLADNEQQQEGLDDEDRDQRFG